MEHKVIDPGHARCVGGRVHFPIESDGVGYVVVAGHQQKGGWVVVVIPKVDAVKVVMVELVPGSGGALDRNFLAVGDIAGDHNIVDWSDGLARCDAFIFWQVQAGQAVQLFHEAGVDGDRRYVAIAVECGSCDPKVDVGGEDYLDGVCGVDSGRSNGGGRGGKGEEAEDGEREGEETEEVAGDVAHDERKYI
jgi:hypothetical protein